jgi:hypothetical protein
MKRNGLATDAENASGKELRILNFGFSKDSNFELNVENKLSVGKSGDKE